MQMKKMFYAVLTALLVLSASSAAFAGTQTERVKNATDRVIDILKDPALKGPKHEKERRRKMMDVAKTVFDFEEMANRSLAQYWRERTPQERKEFVDLFSDLLERSYINRIEGYSNEKIIYDSEKTEDGYAIVKSRIITKRFEEIPVEYRLMQKDGQWRVYDMVIENVSLVNNYRSQFNKIIRSSSYAELVMKMKNKQEGELLVASGGEI